MTTDCPTCGDSFDTTRARNIHHTKQHGESLAEKEQTCNECGDTFFNRRDRKYCSHECQYDSMVVDKTVTCEECGDEFVSEIHRHTAKFCSRECVAENQSERLTATCLICDEDFEHPPSQDAKYCSNHCRLTARWGDYEKRDGEGKYGTRWQKFSRLYRNWVGKCESCGSSENLHTHHDEPVFKGGDLWDNTFTVLCRNCHLGDFKKWH